MADPKIAGLVSRFEGGGGSTTTTSSSSPAAAYSGPVGGGEGSVDTTSISKEDAERTMRTVMNPCRPSPRSPPAFVGNITPGGGTVTSSQPTRKIQPGTHPWIHSSTGGHPTPGKKAIVLPPEGAYGGVGLVSPNRSPNLPRAGE
ncbi:hypothetical protein QOT17_018373 [Balamuthia mandrillaris]